MPFPKKPRVLILDRFYFPDEQATAVYLTELVTAFSEKFEFEVICGSPEVVTEKKIHPTPWLKTHKVFCPKFPKRFLLARVLNDLVFLVLSLFQGLSLRRPDLVVSQTSPPAVWWIGFLISRWHRTRWVQVLQDIFPDNLKCLNGHRNGGFLSLLEPLSSLPLRQSDRIVVVGQDMKDRLLRKGYAPQQINCIQNWSDTNFVHPLPRENFFRRKYKLENKFIALYAGNFGRIHNFEDLLGTAEALKRHTELVFVMVGEGAMKEKLVQECQKRRIENLLIAPFEPRSRLPEVLAAADVSLVLLRRGMAGLSVPSKIYSILASGRPTIACLEEESDIARIVRESNSGFVVPPGDTQEFVRAVQLLRADPEMKEDLGRNARDYAETQDFKALAFRDYEQVFLSALNGN